jgi:hypothetical protein
MIIPVAAACHAEPQTLGVHQTIKNIHALNGKTVRVRGYLGECMGYDCGLFQDRSEWEQTERWLAATAKGQRGHLPPDWLGIGGSPDFDAKAQPFVRRYVLITGKLDDSCRDEQLRPGCTDRAPELEPIAITYWTRSDPAS